MLLAGNTYRNVEAHYQNGSIVVSMYDLGTAVKRLINRNLLLAFVTIAMPFAWLLGLLLGLQTKRLTNRMRLDNEFASTEEYLRYKTLLAKMSLLTPKLKNLTILNLDRAPFQMRFLLKQMMKMSHTILAYENRLQEKLTRYNIPQFPASTHFEFKSESVLWDNRNKAYQYWI